MSTTRKIEGWTHAGCADYYPHQDESVAIFHIRDDHTSVNVPSVLIIGGKALTEEEHEAEFQRRAKALVSDMKDQTMSIAVEQSIDRIAAKHGITP